MNNLKMQLIETIVAILVLTSEGTSENSNSYKAAVAQHASMGSANSPQDTVALNIAAYSNITKQAAAQGAQIITFPEWGLFGDENPQLKRETIIPFCETINDSLSSPTVNQLSALARANSIVIVSNVCEQTEEGKLYNTEVAFSETGNLIAKYHKMHPWFPKTFDTPPEEIITFTTSWGVTFGLIICYDIVHSQPVKDLLSLGVRHFPYSVSFPVEFISSNGFRMFSKMKSVALLASDLGKGGSGLFVKGKSVGTISEDGSFILGEVAV